MKITLINLWRIVNAHGGAEKVFFSMANSLQRQGHNVTSISYDLKKGTTPFSIHPEVNFKNCGDSVYERLLHNNFLAKLKTYHLFNRKERRIARYKLWAQARSKAIAEELQQAQPDVIISFQIETTYLLLDVLQIKTPVITMLHGLPSGYFKKPEFALFKPSLERCDCIQVLMPEFINECLSFIKPKRIAHIPNTVPQFGESSNLDCPTICCVARFEWGKRQHLIVDAFSQLASTFPNWNVEFWGETDFAPDFTKMVKDRIAQYKLEERVKICGTTNDVADKLRHASIFIITSAQEGFCLALTEAMSMGLPSIGCRGTSAVNTLIQDGYNGFLASDNPDNIAEKLKQLMSNRDLCKQMGQNAKHSMRRYAPEEIEKQWELLIKSVTDLDKN